MESKSVTAWINQLSKGDDQAVGQLWDHISQRLHNFANEKLDVKTRRRYDENDAANSAFHSLCRSISEGQIEAANRDAFWGVLAVITSRKIAAQRRFQNRQKRGGGTVRGESEFGEVGINGFDGKQMTPALLAEISENCDELLDALTDETMKKVVLLKFHGAKNAEVATEINCTRRTIERKLERIRRIWVEKGLHQP